MATIEYIKKRITNIENNISVLTARLARIELAEKSNWDDNNPYLYGPNDKDRTIQDLEIARAGLEKYLNQLAEEQAKAASRNVAPILEFLDLWKKRCIEYYGAGLKAVFDDKAEIRALENARNQILWGDPQRDELEKTIQARRRNHYCKLHGYCKTVKSEQWGRVYTESVKIRDGEWEYVKSYVDKNLETSMIKLHAELSSEADRKYDFIVNRACAIVGVITDASGLHVGAKQDLNGIVVGTRGVAKVSTIGAGGHNIQCFHFRTLISPVKGADIR